VYGYQAVNVEANLRTPTSLLNTMRRLIAARKTSCAFGRGSIEFLRPRNQSVLAYLRRHRGETLLVVANLSGSSQPVELDLRSLGGSRVTEILGGTRFPAVGESPYFLSLGPYGYYWFRLEPADGGREPYGIEATAI
jgi:maltose alpha-D-glucosyltransferase/alpha-amylase